MIEYVKIIVIDDMEFVFTEGSYIEFFSENENNYILYNGEKYNISNRYDLPHNQNSIRIKSKIQDEVSIISSDNHSYAVSFSDRDDTIYPGQSDSQFLSLFGQKPATVYIHNIDNSPSDNLQISFLGEYTEDIIDTDEGEIENQFSNMYDSKNQIETIKSKNTIVDDNNIKYYTDIEVISDADKINYLSNIGSGSFRVAYEILDSQKLDINMRNENIILKVSKNMDGVKSNKREFQTWQAVKGTELEEYFCPVYNRGSEFKYIVMEKVDDLTGIDNSKCTEIAKNLREDIKDKIDTENIDPPIVNDLDIYTNNIGIKENGDYVLIDYPYGGSFEYV